MKWLLAGLVTLTAFGAGFLLAQDSREAAKIQYLIASVEDLRGATFVRNGAGYDCREAAAHLRLKLKAAGTRVKTADDFIRLCGSRSSLTGEAYRIRVADGTIMEAEFFLRSKLKAFSADTR